MPDPQAQRPQAQPTNQATKQWIEFILIPAGWVKIDKGSFQVTTAEQIPEVAPWTDDREERWFLCISEQRQILGRCSTIAAVKYSKPDSK